MKLSTIMFASAFAIPVVAIGGVAYITSLPPQQNYHEQMLDEERQRAIKSEQWQAQIVHDAQVVEEARAYARELIRQREAKEAAARATDGINHTRLSNTRTPGGIRIENSEMFLGMPIESVPSLDKLDAAVEMVRMSGWRCDSISWFQNFIFSRGFTLRCNNRAYSYDFADKGGNWVITVE